MKLAAAALVWVFSFFAHAYPIAILPTPYTGSRLFVPNDNAKHTSIVMLHGSEGGSEHYFDGEATLLAAQGYTVLLYCYFDCGRRVALPRETLKNADVTRLLEAVKWLRERPAANRKVVVYGFSRGAELTLVTGSLAAAEERPDGLIAHSPNDVTWGSWNGGWVEPLCALCKKGFGNCPANSPENAYQWNPACGADEPMKDNGLLSAWTVAGRNLPAEKRIEIEKFDGPILITVGEKDEVWGADRTRRVEATLRNAGRSPRVVYFPEAGHVFKGSDEFARRDLVLEFLKKL